MTNDEFHVPFIKNLILIASFTLVSIVLAHYYIHKSFSKTLNTLNTPQYTSSQPYDAVKTQK